MYKCINCGNEFEGNFCPECGAKRQEEIKCPECGAVLSPTAKFCNECGHSFIVQSEDTKIVTNEKPVYKPAPNSGIAEKFYGISNYIPAFLFAIFSVLLFVFYALPIIIIPGGEFFGEKIPSESLGSVYSLLSGFEEVPEIHGAMSALIVLACFSAVFAALACVSLFVPLLKFKTIGAKGYKLSSLISAMSVLFYLVILIIASVAAGEISKADDGAGLFVAGAGIKLLISFSAVFLALAAAVFGLRVNLNRKNPDLYQSKLQKEETARDAFRRSREETFAVLPEPVAPKKPVEVAKPSYPQEGIFYPANRVLGGKRALLISAVLAIFNLGFTVLLSILSYYISEPLHIIFIVLQCIFVLIVLPVQTGLNKNLCKSAVKKTPRGLISNGVYIFAGVIIVLTFVWIAFYCVSVILGYAGYSFEELFFLIPGLIFSIEFAVLTGLQKKHTKSFANELYEGKRGLYKLTEAGEHYVNERDAYMSAVKAYKDYKKVAKNYKFQSRAYNLERRLYKNKRNYTKFPKCLMWFYVRKFTLALSAISLSAVIAVSCVAAGILTDKFRAGKVDNINLGDTKSRVEKVLGEPDIVKDYVYYYVDKNYKSLLDKAEANEKKQLEAREKGDEASLEKLVKEAEELAKKTYETQYKYIGVYFNDDIVSSIMFETKACDKSRFEATDINKYFKKEVKNIQLVYWDNYNDKWRNATIKKNKLYGKDVKLKVVYGHSYDSLYESGNYLFGAKIYYEDGSYQLDDISYIVKNAIVALDNGQSVNGLNWSDVYGEYTIEFQL